MAVDLPWKARVAMFDPGHLFAARLWRPAPWRHCESWEELEPELPGPAARGAAFGIVLGLIIALIFWAAVALLVF
jgi:hypothetical protein